MPAKTMAPIVEEEATKKEEQSNVTKRRPLRGRSMFVAPSIAEESEEIPEESGDLEKKPGTKQTEAGNPKNDEKLEVAKKINEDKPKKKNNNSQ